MHCDEHGVWSANITVFGAWGPGLGYTFDFLTAAPALKARRRMIERGHPWFSLIDLEIPVNDRRPVPLALHIASITGTVWAPDLEAELFACADAVVFYAETVRHQLHRTKYARRDLDRWIEERGADAIVVFQLDRPFVDGSVYTYDPAGIESGEEPIVALDAEAMRTELAIGSRPVVETNAREHQLGILFRVVVAELLAARDRLPPRPAYDKSTGA